MDMMRVVQPSLLRMLRLAMEEFEIGQQESQEMGSTLDYVILADQVRKASHDCAFSAAPQQ